MADSGQTNGVNVHLHVTSSLVNGCTADSQSQTTEQDVRYQSICETAEYLLSRTHYRPTIAIVCGTGLAGLGQLVNDSQEFPYETIPHFPQTAVKGHVGRLLFGTLSGRVVVVMQGRVHAYEGHSMWQITFPIRVFQALGIRTLVVTNASGSVRADFKPGDLMIIRDHINLPGMSGLNPLIGHNDDRLGRRFPALSAAYDSKLSRLLSDTAVELGLSYMRRGVYLCQSGPCYESPAECLMARSLGADVVGMSTCPEVIVARHAECPMRCVGLSLITNSCVMTYDDDYDDNNNNYDDGDCGRGHKQTVTANHEEILEIANWRADDLKSLVANFVGKISD